MMSFSKLWIIQPLTFVTVISCCVLNFTLLGEDSNKRKVFTDQKYTSDKKK